jgi:hypothetical protein
MTLDSVDTSGASLNVSGIGSADGDHRVEITVEGDLLGILTVLPECLEWTRPTDAPAADPQTIYWQELANWAPGRWRPRPDVSDFDAEPQTASNAAELLALFGAADESELQVMLDDVAQDEYVYLTLYPEGAEGTLVPDGEGGEVTFWGQVDAGRTGLMLIGSISRASIIDAIETAEDEIKRESFVDEVENLEYSLEVTVPVPGDGTQWVTVFADEEEIGQLLVEPDAITWTEEAAASEVAFRFTWGEFTQWAEALRDDWMDVPVLRHGAWP